MNTKLSEPYNYQNDKEYSENDFFSFWDDVAKKYVKWDKMYEKVYSGNELKPDWFKGGKLNACYNVLDIHALNDERKDQIAIIYECPFKGLSYKITYKQLWEQVCLFSRALKNLGVKKGDGVLIYMRSSIQVAIAMLSCSRIGAIHCVVFAAYYVKALCDRIDAFKPKLIISADCTVFGKELVYYLPLINSALELSNHKVENVIVYNRTDLIGINQEKPQVSFKSNLTNYLDWNEIAKDIEPLLEYEILDSLDQISLCYSSGTSGVPKGFEYFVGPYIALNQYTSECIYNVKQGDVFFSSCDVGWQVAQAVNIYSCLQIGATSVLYEGDMGAPNSSINMLKIIEKHKVNILVIAPSEAKVIRSDYPNFESISPPLNLSLQNVFMIGEKLDESIVSYFENITGVKVWDHYGQTEVGCTMLVYPSLKIPRKFKSSGKPLPGFNMTIVSNENKTVKPFEIGEIVFKLPLPPNVITTLFKDQKSYNKLYLSRNKGYFSTNDLGYYDEEGYYYLVSRVDDLINVYGDLINGIESEEIILKHSMVSNCCVLGVNDDIYGSRLVALIIPKTEYLSQFKDEQFLNKVHSELNLQLINVTGELAKLKFLIPISTIPRNRNGKIPRKVLTKILNNDPYKTPITMSNVNDLKTLSLEIEQYKLNIPAQCLEEEFLP